MVCLGPLICMWTKTAAGKITWLQNTVAVQTNTELFRVYMKHRCVCSYAWLTTGNLKKVKFQSIMTGLLTENLCWGQKRHSVLKWPNITSSKFESSDSAFLEIHSVVPTPWWHMSGQRERLLCSSKKNHFIKFCYTFGPKHSSEEGQIGFLESFFFWFRGTGMLSWGSRAELFNTTFCNDVNAPRTCG